MGTSLTLRSIGILGALVSSLLFTMTFATQNSIERAGQAFIKYQVEKEVKEKLESTKLTGVKENAQALSNKFGIDIDKDAQDLEDHLPQKIASVIAEMCKMDCQQRKKLEDALAAGYKDRISSLSFAQTKLADLIKGKYLEIVQNLTMDVRIFLGSNASLFALLLAISFLRPQALKHSF